MLVFLKCVAEAVAENGLRGLAGMAPGGQFAYDVAKAALDKYRQRRKDDQIRADIQQLAQASFEQAREAAVVAVREAVTAAPADDLARLEQFLTGVPAATQQSLKRSDDPTGTTVPDAFRLGSPEDVLRLLPPRPPRFRAGDPFPGRPGWVLDRPLGVGGFGEVWLARHPQIASLVGAVKFCHDLSARDRDLLHEGRVIDRVMAQGRHPNIVALQDAHLDGDTPWLLYEYVPGGDLADWTRSLQRHTPEQRVRQAVAALRQLAGAVGHFHRLDPPVVHRDLKPANILLDRANKRLRITDFGIGGVAARSALEAEAGGTTTRGGRLLSYLRGSYTPLYASPQQRDGAAPDPRDDVHALGVIGYQLLTGHLGQGAGPDFAEDVRDAGASDDLVGLLGRCVAQRSDRRPRDAGELADALAQLSARQGNSASQQPGPPPPPSDRGRARTHTRPPRPSKPAAGTTIFPLVLHPTYRKQGFFNVRAEYDHLVRDDEGPVTVVLVSTNTEVSIEAHVDRTANSNRTARIRGGVPLRDWFQRHYEDRDQVDVDFRSPKSIRITAPGR